MGWGVGRRDEGGNGGWLLQGFVLAELRMLGVGYKFTTFLKKI